jgi:hypothetical protein
VKPTEKSFGFSATHDGTFWLTVALKDKQGNDHETGTVLKVEIKTETPGPAVTPPALEIGAAGPLLRPELAPLPPDLRGQVKSVGDDGLVLLSIGSDVGLKEGHLVEAYRTEPKPQYLGRIQVVKVSPKESVGRPATPQFKDALRAGDQVAGRIQPSQ